MDAWRYLIRNCIDIYRKNILIIYDDSTENLKESLEEAVINEGKT